MNAKKPYWPKLSTHHRHMHGQTNFFDSPCKCLFAILGIPACTQLSVNDLMGQNLLRERNWISIHTLVGVNCAILDVKRSLKDL